VRGRVEIGFATQPPLDLRNPRLEQADMLLERRKVSLEDLATPALVRQGRLNPSELLRDGVVLLLQALQPAVDLIEVAENLPEALVHLSLESIEPPIQEGEAPVHLQRQVIEAPVDPGELALDLSERAVDLTEPAVDLAEPALDLAELPSQELDQLLILARTHGAYLPQPPELFNCIAS